MIIARGSSGDDRQLLLLGLSRANLDKLVSGLPIRLRKQTHEGIPDGWELVVVFGETEAALANLLTSATPPVEPVAEPAQQKPPSA